jgi:hypothetical protein
MTPPEEDLGPPRAAGDHSTGASSAVPSHLRAYARSALQIDQQIHELARRLGAVLDAYRATRPEFGAPLPRLEYDLARYARRCQEIDLWVGRVADAFERAGARGNDGLVLADDLAVTDALHEAQAQQRDHTAPTAKKHHDAGGGGLLGVLGGVAHAVWSDPIGAGEGVVGEVGRLLTHPGDVLGGAAHVAEDLLHDFSSPLGGLVHSSKLLSTAVALLTPWGLAAADAEAFVRDPLGSAEDFGSGLLSGLSDLKDLGVLLSKLQPQYLLIDPQEALRTRLNVTRGLMQLGKLSPEYAILDPVGAVVKATRLADSTLDLQDLKSGNLLRWQGRMTPGVLLALLGGGAAPATRVAVTASEGAAVPGAAQVAAALGTEDAAATSTAYAEALAGGRNSGFLRNYVGRSQAELERGIRSLQRQIDLHLRKIAAPGDFIENWDGLSPTQQKALVGKKWPADIARQRAQLTILESLLRSHHGG